MTEVRQDRVRSLSRCALAALAITLFVAVLGLTAGTFAILGVQVLPLWTAVAPPTEPAGIDAE